jgi:hypothetical protein
MLSERAFDDCLAQVDRKWKISQVGRTGTTAARRLEEGKEPGRGLGRRKVRRSGDGL